MSMNRANRLSAEYSSRKIAVVIPIGNATNATIVDEQGSPDEPLSDPASAGLLDKSDVRKSTPRSAKTGCTLASCVPTRTSRTASERSSASNRAPAKTSPAMSTARRRTGPTSIDGRWGSSHGAALVLLPRSAHEHIADDVQGEGQEEQQQPEEEQALECGGVPGHLVAARGQ